MASSTTLELTQSPRYTALPTEGRFTRVVQLLPGKGDTEICCRLLQVNLDELQVNYTAVSYTWGSPYPQKTILLNDSLFPVRQNLFDLLKAFRDARMINLFWIDALCIDQASLIERNHQVGHMREIFAQATQVFAWLGDSNRAIHNAIVTINEITTMSQDQQMQLSEHSIGNVRSSLRIVDGRTYWTRAWIIQELILAKTVMFFAGKDCFSWDQLTHAVSMVDKHTVPHLRSIIVAQQLGQDTWSFEQLFARFGYLACTHEVDRFYSLHGLIDATSNNLPAPDYSLCINEVFMQHLGDLQETLLEQRLDFIQNYISYSDFGCACHQNTTLDLRIGYHGEFRSNTPSTVAGHSSGPSGRQRDVDILLYSRRDMYGSRQIDCAGSTWAPRAEDLVFRLNGVWYLVYRQKSPANTLGRGDELVGLIDHSSRGPQLIDIPAHIKLSFENSPLLLYTANMQQLSGSDGVTQYEAPHQFQGSLTEPDTSGPELRLQIHLLSLFELILFMRKYDRVYRDMMIPRQNSIRPHRNRAYGTDLDPA